MQNIYAILYKSTFTLSFSVNFLGLPSKISLPEAHKHKLCDEKKHISIYKTSPRSVISINTLMLERCYLPAIMAGHKE